MNEIVIDDMEFYVDRIVMPQRLGLIN